jgi:hypothetical protein
LKKVITSSKISEHYVQSKSLEPNGGIMADDEKQVKSKKSTNSKSASKKTVPESELEKETSEGSAAKKPRRTRIKTATTATDVTAEKTESGANKPNLDLDSLSEEQTARLFQMLAGIRQQAGNTSAEEGENAEGVEGEDSKPPIPDILPILPLKDTVVFPLTVFPLAVGQERSLRLIEDITGPSGSRIVGLIAQKNLNVEQAGPGDSYSVGTVALVHKLLKVPDGTIRLAVQG